jgi:hypothetical protein
MPEYSATPLSKLQAIKVPETLLAVHSRSAKRSILPYTTPGNTSKKLRLLHEIGAKHRGMTKQFMT